MILEDLHNASAATIELIHYLTTRLKDSPVLIVLSFRGSLSAVAQRYTDVPNSQSLGRIDLGGDETPLSIARAERKQHWRKYLSTRPAIFVSSVLLLISMVVIVASVQRVHAGQSRGNVLADTLVLTEKSSANAPFVLYALGGDIGSDLEEIAPAVDSSPAARWASSVSLPWINPAPSPNGEYVGVERMTSGGTDVYVIDVTKGDTLPLVTGRGNDIISGWSPDGLTLLVIRSEQAEANETHDNLYAYQVRLRKTIALDTSAQRSVTHAIWSPVGTHVAWTARSNRDNQQDIFIARADGSNIVNVTNHPAEDYNLAWAPDGSWVAFTSERDGSADLYSIEILTGRLRRLTWETGQDDNAHFSPDGRFVAYESVRDGERGVYVTAFWGGTPRRVTQRDGIGTRLNIAGWRGPPPRYTNRIYIDVAKEFTGSTSAYARALDQHGDSIRMLDVEWTVLDSATARFHAAPVPRTSEELEDYVPSGRLLGIKPGPARLVAAAPGWRAETTFVVVK